MQSLQGLKDLLFPAERTPVLFLGHGNPLYAIKENSFSNNWRELGTILPKPQALLVISAHWITSGTTLVDISKHPRTVHDFWGFPAELSAVSYPAPGAPELAQDVVTMLTDHQAKADDSWGLDHGAWSVLKHLFPHADIPVFQLSIDMSRDLDWHLALGRELRSLRDRGVLILGSGNIVHNLRAMRRTTTYDWAENFDLQFTRNLEKGDLQALADRGKMGKLYELAHPSSDHYIPALVATGAADNKDQLLFFNDAMDMGSISMRSFVYF